MRRSSSAQVTMRSAVIPETLIGVFSFYFPVIRLATLVAGRPSA